MQFADDDQLLLAHQVHSLLEIVVSTNRAFLRKLKDQIPPLYSSGVVWRLEPWAGVAQHFANCLEVLDQRWGCCKALCAYRLAELREADPDRDHLYGFNLSWDVLGKVVAGSDLHRAMRSKPGAKIYLHHVQLTLPNDGWEDPSRLLQQ
jgi:hypothetical protein